MLPYATRPFGYFFVSAGWDELGLFWSVRPRGWFGAKNVLCKYGPHGTGACLSGK